MMDWLKSLVSKGAPETRQARIPAGQRVYAIGDIHGRADLFRKLIGLVEADDARAKLADTTVILLGDLVDRGPDSAGVLALARKWKAHRNVRILMGNHEEMFLKSFGNIEILRHFLRHGGRETLFSFGISRQDFTAATAEEVQQLLHTAVPARDRAFVEGFEDIIAIGDYVFVHAGIDPATPLDQQTPNELRWIREPFLSHGDPYGFTVVHGHTIADEPVETINRIGIDTGAYASGRLTAVALEGTTRRYLTAHIALREPEDEGGAQGAANQS